MRRVPADQAGNPVFYEPQTALGAPNQVKPAHRDYIQEQAALSDQDRDAQSRKEALILEVMANQAFDAWRNSPDASSIDIFHHFAGGAVQRFATIRPTSKGFRFEAQARRGVVLSLEQKERLVQTILERLRLIRADVVRTDVKMLSVFFRAPRLEVRAA